MKTDCFAYMAGGCTALTEMLCRTGKCPFFRTTEENIKLIKFYNDKTKDFYERSGSQK